MTINWFSPVPPTRSSIALDTATIVPELAKRAKVVVWAHEQTWTRSLEEHAEVRHYSVDAIPWRAINAADVTIYHIGNEPEYHGAIWQAQRQHPGIVVLHDLNLQHFFAGSLSSSRITRSEYLQVMTTHHGARGQELAEAFMSGSKTADEIGDECPLTAAALVNAERVIVHTMGGYAQVVSCSDRPVAYVPLFVPSLKSASACGAGRHERSTKHGAGEPYRIIIFGILGRNRRLASVFRALHHLTERQRFHLDIYGAVTDEKLLRQMVADLGLKSVVSFHGFVADEELDRALERSDLALNLRDPTMGEASASQLRIWQHGVPSLVTDIGWYASLPENTVAKVRREAELEDLHLHLTQFLAAPERYVEIGEHGRRYVNEHHTVSAYLDRLLEIIDATLAARPQDAVRWISERAGRGMSPWFNAADGDVLLPGVARAIRSIFDENTPAR